MAVEVTDEITLGIGAAEGPSSAPVAWELVFLEREGEVEALRVKLAVLAAGEVEFTPNSERAVVRPAT